MEAEPRVRVVPGNGVVSRFGPVVAIVLGDAVDADSTLLALLERLGNEGDQLDPQAFTRELVAHLAVAGSDPMPDVGAVALLAGRLAVVLRGAVDCRADRSDGPVRLRGRDAAVSVNVVLDGPFTQVALHPEGDDPGAGQAWSHLAAGVVPGSAAVVVQDVAPEPATERDATGPGATADDEETTELAQPRPVDVPPAADTPARDRPAPRQPLPIGDDAAAPGQAVAPEGQVGDLVEGIECEDGHFNHPYALQCSVCGRSLLDSARRTVHGPRQPLGTLTLEDGTSYVMDASYVVGREPEEDPAVRAEQARPLRLEDPDHLVSRVHADIRLIGWDVQVVDRDSANGTYVLPPEGNDWLRVATGEPRTISPGTRVSIGRKIMTYEW